MKDTASAAPAPAMAYSARDRQVFGAPDAVREDHRFSLTGLGGQRRRDGWLCQNRMTR